MTPVQNFVDAALGLVGVPWRHQGRSVAGIDCAGLIAVAAMAVGIVVRDRANYRVPADPVLLIESLVANCDRDTAPVLCKGRIAVFRITGKPQHVAILTSDSRMVHAVDRGGIGRVAVGRVTDEWLTRIDSTWRLRGVDYGEGR